MGLSLAIKNNEDLTIEERKEIELQISEIINKHRGNSVEINKLVFDSVTALTASESRREELEDQGALKRFWGGLTGKNKGLQGDIDRNLQKAQYSSQQTLQKLAEQNLMSFELITAVNNKLNSSILEVENEINDIYKTLITFFKQTRSDIIQIETRLDKLEKNVNILNWVNTIPYQMVNGIEYCELNKIEKIVFLTKDFYEITKGKWTTSDLLQLKPAIAQIGLSVKENVSYRDFIEYISENNDLYIKLIDEDIKTIGDIKENGISIVDGLVKGKHLDSDEEYILNTVESELKEHGVSIDRRKLKYSILEKYIAQTSYVDINSEVNIFDFVLELLFNIHIFDNTMSEVYKNSDIDYEELRNLELDTLKKYAEKGSSKAQNVLGTAYFLGGEAEERIREIQSAINLENIYYKREKVEKDEDQAFHWYLKSAKQGNSDGENLVGCMYIWGLGVEKDSKEGMKWLLKSADEGNSDAQAWAGVLYYSGEGVEHDPEKGFKFILKSANQGNAMAQFFLGSIYYDGDGVEKDYEQAFKWIKKSAEQRYAEAENMLCDFYYDGIGVEKDSNEVYKWCKRSAEQGHSEAQKNLGLCYTEGIGVEIDLDEAFKWYLKSSEQEYAEAQKYLADCYYEGEGTVKNIEEARKWYEKAAEQGYEKAKIALREKF